MRSICVYALICFACALGFLYGFYLSSSSPNADLSTVGQPSPLSTGDHQFDKSIESAQQPITKAMSLQTMKQLESVDRRLSEITKVGPRMKFRLNAAQLLSLKSGLMWAPVEQQRFLLGYLTASNHILQSKEPIFQNTPNSFLAAQHFLAQDLYASNPLDGNVKRLRPRVMIVSASIGDRPYGRMTKQHVQAYAKFKQYDLSYYDRRLNASYSLTWQKILMIREALNDSRKPDVILWLDDDVVITNWDVNVENYLELASPQRQLYFVVSQDKHNMPHCLFNSGVLVLKNNREMKSYFERVLESFDEIPYYQTHSNWEQDVMNLILYETPKLYDHALVLNQCLLQVFDSSWEPGDFAIHTPGLGRKEKTKIVQYLLTMPPRRWIDIPRLRQKERLPCMRE